MAAKSGFFFQHFEKQLEERKLNNSSKKLKVSANFDHIP